MKSPLQTLSQEANKRINCCKNCDGAGLQPWVHPTYRTSATKDMCKPCKGKGYMIPLEEGCEVELYKEVGSNSHDYDVVTNIQYSNEQGLILKRCGEVVEDKDFIVWGKQAEITDDINKNLGKPLTLQDILLALGDDYGVYGGGDVFQFDSYTSEGDHYISRTGVILDLTKTPQEWDDETIEAIIKLIK